MISQPFCSCAGCLLFLLLLPWHTWSTVVAIFRNPVLALVAVGRFPSAGTSHRSPRRGALVQQGSPQLVLRALLIRSSPLPYIILVYILGLCGSLHTNRHLNCVWFAFSVLSQPLKLQSFFGTVFVFTYSHKLREHNELCCKEKRNIQGMFMAILHRTQVSTSNFTLGSLAFLVHTLAKSGRLSHSLAKQSINK